MTGFFVFAGGLALIAGIVTLLDTLGRRQRRKAHRNP
jgi:hypothetical protein